MRTTSILCFVLMALPLTAAPRPDPSSSLQDALYNEEQQLASAEKRQDKAYLERVLDDEIIYVAYNGLVLTKAKMVDSMKYINVAQYSIENLKVRRLGAAAGLVTYDLALDAKVAGHGLPASSTVWLKRGGRALAPDLPPIHPGEPPLSAAQADSRERSRSSRVPCQPSNSRKARSHCSRCRCCLSRIFSSQGGSRSKVMLAGWKFRGSAWVM